MAPILQGFFIDRLARQKKASPNTVAAYRDTCKLLLTFAQEQTGKPPARLSLADLDATLLAHSCGTWKMTVGTAAPPATPG
jgi:hypothetical protein